MHLLHGLFRQSDRPFLAIFAKDVKKRCHVLADRVELVKIRFGFEDRIGRMTLKRPFGDIQRKAATVLRFGGKRNLTAHKTNRRLLVFFRLIPWYDPHDVILSAERGVDSGRNTDIAFRSDVFRLPQGSHNLLVRFGETVVVFVAADGLERDLLVVASVIRPAGTSEKRLEFEALAALVKSPDDASALHLARVGGFLRHRLRKPLVQHRDDTLPGRGDAKKRTEPDASRSRNPPDESIDPLLLSLRQRPAEDRQVDAGQRRISLLDSSLGRVQHRPRDIR